MTNASIDARVQSTDAIRQRFPALERREGGRWVAYFDGPGGTQVPREVADAMTGYLLHHNANTHWAYPTSIETDAAIARARRTIADFLNARDDEIAFGQNMTSLTFHVARGIGRRLNVGDEIVVTELDHHANIAPWRALADERGVTVRMVRMHADTGQLDWEDLERSISNRTKVVAIGAASNALGTINDIVRATRLAHSAGAIAFVDAVHYAPHQLVDVRAIGCDFLACSAYKFYGPHVGIVYGTSERILEVDVPRLEPAPDTAPERLETGTQNHEGIVGAAAAVDFLASLGTGETRRARLQSALDGLHARGSALVTSMWNGLTAIPGVRVFGPPPSAPRTPTISFVVAGRSSTDVARRLADRALYASNGDFYAATVIERIGMAPDGVVRAGCACYTTEDEVQRLVEAVAEIAKN
ncbi:MAG TPA: cysteine desulfurase-like protein [Gemmatimonadaceae bacterium]|nr:cysteine desulfurase-like protein [Gemmatimonadaceae bacterium]